MLGGFPVVVGGPVVVVLVPGVDVVVDVGQGQVGVVVGRSRGGTVGGIVIGHLSIRTGQDVEAPK